MKFNYAAPAIFPLKMLKSASEKGVFRFVASLCLLALAFDLGAQCENASVSAGDDKYICNPPNPVMLDGDVSGQYLSLQWTPPIGLIGANTLTPIANVTQTTTYVLTARMPDFGTNLIANGDFSGGGAGFSSDYSYSPGNLWPEGTYDITNNPQSSHSNFAPCQDHTGGGDMMVVNGSGDPGTNVWCQDISTEPNTEYIFSAWVTSVNPVSPAQLQFSINGVTLGGIFSAPGGTCGWANFYQAWNSGANGSASICIVNQNTTLSGNDFALDDLGFFQVCKPKDSVTVYVANVNAVANPPQSYILCDGAPLTLNGTGSSTGVNVSYEWQTTGGNIVSGDNTLNPVVNAAGEYTLTVHYDDGNIQCEKSATVNVGVNAVPLSPIISPPPPLSCATPTVNIVAAPNQQPGPFTYLWETPNGNITGAATNPVINVNQPGTYNVTITSTPTGCSGTGTVSVTSNGLPPTAVAAANDTLDCSTLSVMLSGAGSTSGTNINYAWNSPNGGTFGGATNGPNANATGPGMFILTVTNPVSGCSARDTVVVVANRLAPNVSLVPAGTLDCDTDTLPLSASATPTGNVLFAWTASGGGHIAGGQSTASPLVDAPGTYTVVGTNTANGCRDTASVTVSANLVPPLAAIAAPDSISCQRQQVSLAGSMSGAANLTFAWTASGGGNFVSGDNTLNPAVNAAGNYNLLVTNPLNGCTAAATVHVVADTNAVKSVANAPAAITCTANQVALNANGSSTGAAIQYTWTAVSPGANLSGPANATNVTATAPGTYQLLVSNPQNGCTAIDLVNVVENKTAPNAQIQPAQALDCQTDEITLNAQNSSNGANFNFVWAASGGGHFSQNQNSLTPSVDMPGSYAITITDLQNGCTASTSVTVSENMDAPLAAIAPPGVLTCAASQVALQGSASNGQNLAFQWTTSGTGQLSGDPNTATATATAPGTYTLEVTNPANGCTVSVTVEVRENKTPPPADAGAPGTLTCADPSFNLQANLPAGNNFQLNWSASSGGQILGPTDIQNPICTAAGTYTLSVIDPVNGCSSSDNVEISENKIAPTLSILPPETITCAQPISTLLAVFTAQSPTPLFQWQTTNGSILDGDDTANPQVNAAGTYRVTLTDPANGCTATATASVLQNAVFPAANAGPSPTLTCQTDEVQLSATGDAGPDITYSWTTQNGQISAGETTLNPSVIAPGNYILSVFNALTGCTGTSAVEVFENKIAPPVEAGVDDTLTCGLQNLTIAGASSGQPGQFSYQWTTPNGLIVNGSTTLAPTIGAPGEYVLQVTDPTNGCTAADAVQILKDANAPLADAGQPATLTCETTEVQLAGNGSTGANISYSWAIAAGSTGHFAGPTNTLTPSVDQPGTYVLTVANTTNGCTTIASVTVEQDIAPPLAEAGPTATLNCQTTTLNLQGAASASSGAAVSIAWTAANGGQIAAGANTATPSIDRPGTFTILVKNLENGCESSDLVQIGIDTIAPTASIAAPQTLTCTRLTTTLQANLGPNLPNFSAIWAAGAPPAHLVSGQNSLTPLVDNPGSYILTIRNLDNGCVASFTTSVSENVQPPLAEAGQGATLTCTQTSATLNGAGSSVGAGFSYQWTASAGGIISSGGTTLQPVAGAAGTYTISVTDAANGCTSTDFVQILSNTVPPPAVIAPPETLTCTRTEVSLNAAGSGAGTTFLASWNTPSGNIVSGQNTLAPVVNAPGTYILNIENQTNGCIGTANVLVAQNVQAPQAEAGPTGVLHCNQAQITLAGSSQTPGASFVWATADGHISGANNTASPAVDAPGSYRVTVTNPQNGCTATDEVNITEIPAPAFAPEVLQPDCHSKVGSIEAGAVSGGLPPFEFALGSGAFQSENFFDDLVPGTYDVTVRDANGCTALESATVQTPFAATLSIGPIDVLEFGDSVRLNPLTNIAPGQVATWLWSPATDLSCSDCPRPYARPFQNQQYTLIVSDLNGCTASATALVRVDRTRNVYVPNAFSPNGDGNNDFFTVYAKGVLKVRNLHVYDRWGNALFFRDEMDPNDEQAGWHGDFRGKTMTPAVFVWYCEVEFLDGKRAFYSGDVSLLAR